MEPDQPNACGRFAALALADGARPAEQPEQLPPLPSASPSPVRFPVRIRLKLLIITANYLPGSSPFFFAAAVLPPPLFAAVYGMACSATDEHGNFPICGYLIFPFAIFNVSPPKTAP